MTAPTKKTDGPMTDAETSRSLLAMLEGAFKAGVTTTALHREEIPSEDATGEEIDEFCERMWGESLIAAVLSDATAKEA